jgi:hypothetical protein
MGGALGPNERVKAYLTPRPGGASVPTELSAVEWYGLKIPLGRGQREPDVLDLRCQIARAAWAIAGFLRECLI